jgi:hypothetical protein
MRPKFRPVGNAAPTKREKCIKEAWGRILIESMGAEKVPFQRLYFLLGFVPWRYSLYTCIVYTREGKKGGWWERTEVGIVSLKYTSVEEMLAMVGIGLTRNMERWKNYRESIVNHSRSLIIQERTISLRFLWIILDFRSQTLGFRIQILHYKPYIKTTYAQVGEGGKTRSRGDWE